MVNKKLETMKPYTLPQTLVPVKYKLDIIEYLQEHHYSIKSVFEKNSSGIHLYPHAKSEEHLLEKLRKYTHCPHEAEILLTHGSDSALDTIIRAMTNPEDTIGYPIPNYPHFISMAKMSACNTLEFPLSSPEEILSLDLSCVNLMYISSPNLPLGYRLKMSEVQSLLEKWPDVYFIIDEAYHEYSDQRDESPVILLDKYKNLFVTRTFSKAFGLAGLRIGYAISNKENMKYLKIVHNEKSVTEVAIECALAAILNLDHYLENVHEIQESKKYLQNMLNLLIQKDDEIYNFSIQDGNFFLIFAKDPKKICDIFESLGIMIRDKSSEIPGAIRIGMSHRKVQEDVLGVIRAINWKSLLRNNGAIYDLDNTLRSGSNSWNPLYEDSLKLLKKNDLIVTNNGRYTSEELSAQTGIPRDMINSPIDRAISIPNKKILIIGPESLQISDQNVYFGSVSYWYPDHSFDMNSFDLVIVTYINNMQIIHDLSQVPGKILYTDSNEYCPRSDYNNRDKDQDHKKDTKCLDLGSIIPRLFPSAILFDKVTSRSLIPKNDPKILIGDSDKSDGLLASKLGCLFIKIIPAPNQDQDPKKNKGIVFKENSQNGYYLETSFDTFATEFLHEI